MKITIEPTDKIIVVSIAGGGSVPVRVWEGVTDLGVECHMFVTRVAVPVEGDGPALFRVILQEQRPPRNPDVAAYPNRLIL